MHGFEARAVQYAENQGQLLARARRIIGKLNPDVNEPVGRTNAQAPVEFWGDVYDEHTDWRYLVAHPYFGHGWEAKWADAASAIGALAEALRGTPMEIGLANAALEVIERGIEAEMDVVQSAGYERGTNAFERLLAVLERDPRTPSARWVGILYDDLFRLNSADPRLNSAFTKDVNAASGEELSGYLSLAARYNLDWLVEHLPSLRPPLTAKFWQWLFEDICGTGGPRLPKTKLELTRALQSHPAFQGRL